MTVKAGWGMLALLGMVGCVTSSSIRSNDLTGLDGYRGGQWASGAQRPIETLAGDRLIVRSSDYLFLEKPGLRVGARFESIRVRDGVFNGRTVDGRHVQVPLQQLTRVEVYQYNPRPLVAITTASLLVLLAGGLLVHYTNPLRTY